MSEIKIALQKSWKRDRKKASEKIPKDVSPDSKCPICLDVFNNVSYLDLCLHKFCFRCIHEWSKNKAECPLCKQPFNSIYHSIKSDEDFQKYDLRPVENGSFGNFGGVRFRYRSTITGFRRQLQTRTDPLPDNGVMFEATANAVRQRRDRYLRSIMSRLAAERQAASEGRVLKNLREQEMVNFRKELYRHGLKVQTVTDGGRSRDTSAEFYRRNPACLHRLVPWIKRELLVLFGAHGSLVNIVQHIIMSSITRNNVEDEAMQEALTPFLQGRTEQFLHEFVSFAKSPFNMEAYDQHAVYDCPASSSNENSSGNSSVIAISDYEENADLEPPRTPGNSMSTLSNSLWDDETPGPSYFTTAESHRNERLLVLDSDSGSEEERPVGSSSPGRSPRNQRVASRDFPKDGLSSDSDDCVIVGVVKPTGDRTPELVRLSSDSSDSTSEDCKEVARVGQHIRFTSLSPTSDTAEDTCGSRRLDPKERRSPAEKYRTSRKSGRQDRETVHPGIDRCRDAESRLYRRNRNGRRSPEDRTVHRERSCSPPTGKVWYSKYDRKESWAGWKSPQYSSRSNSRHSRTSGAGGRHHSHHSRRRDSRSPSRGSNHRRSRTYSSSRSPSLKRAPHSDKPGGKRKYKTRHLEEPKEHSASDSQPRKRSKEKRHKKSRSRDSSPSGRSKRHHKKSKKHKKKSKKHKSKERKEKPSPALGESKGEDVDGASVDESSCFQEQGAEEITTQS